MIRQGRVDPRCEEAPVFVVRAELSRVSPECHQVQILVLPAELLTYRVVEKLVQEPGGLPGRHLGQEFVLCERRVPLKDN